ncbi:MAG TPA: superoxide dismutase family protein [Ruminococcus sp.]|nr:superoxide dismutase family protein [Ruminococcus sp.]
MYQFIQQNLSFPLCSILNTVPQAIAWVTGSPDFSDISGRVRFYPTNRGILICAEISGLPYLPETCDNRVFGFHIHAGMACEGNHSDAFSEAGTHYNPDSCEHPHHAGDLPPLFGNNGYALSVFLTDRFTISEIIGKTVIIHDSPDDFTTQPSGNSGTKIACGIITKTS